MHAIDAPLPGIYEDVPGDEYHRWLAVGSSTISNLRRSPLYCRYRQTTPEPERTPAQRAALDFGSAVHCRLLEPDRYEAAYAPAVFHDADGKRLHPNSNAYKAKRAEAESYGVTLLNPDRMADVERIAERIFEDGGAAAKLLEAADAVEISYVAEDPESGVILKARPDALVPGCIVDIKTAADPTPSGFAKSVANYGYHRQASLYKRVCALAEDDAERSHVILAIANTPPFEYGLYALDYAALYKGGEEVTEALALYAHCQELDEWPGLPETVVPLGLPGWALR